MYLSNSIEISKILEHPQYMALLSKEKQFQLRGITKVDYFIETGKILCVKKMLTERFGYTL